eukprot:COSAG01_NODE_2481_length_7603_cov_4.629398_10_plen_243_part_00
MHAPTPRRWPATAARSGSAECERACSTAPADPSAADGGQPGQLLIPGRVEHRVAAAAGRYHGRVRGRADNRLWAGRRPGVRDVRAQRGQPANPLSRAHGHHRCNLHRLSRVPVPGNGHHPPREHPQPAVPPDLDREPAAVPKCWGHAAGRHSLAAGQRGHCVRRHRHEERRLRLHARVRRGPALRHGLLDGQGRPQRVQRHSDRLQSVCTEAGCDGARSSLGQQVGCQLAGPNADSDNGRPR